MATAEGVKAKIQGLIDKSNATTGNTDNDLTSAVGALIAGFGQVIEPSGSLNIRTNGTYDVTAYAEALVDVDSSGGASAVYSGSFTPAENLQSVTVDIGGSFTHFVCYAISSVVGHSVKASAAVIVDVVAPCCTGISTNNAGTSLSVVPVSYSVSGNDQAKFFILNNTRVTVTPDSLGIDTTTVSGTCLGYFVAGVTYLWYAW